jgi:hypothetical protein
LLGRREPSLWNEASPAAARTGGPVNQPIYGIDLAALCIRR